MAVIAPIISTFDSKGVKDAEKAFGSLKKQLTSALGVAAFVQFGRAAINAAEEGQKSAARIQQIAKQMGLFGTETAKVTQRLLDYSDTLARSTGVDDDVIKSTQAKLLTFQNLAKSADTVGGAFDRATRAALDLAAAGFGEAEGNAVLLGKALQDPVKGLTALTRAGVTFTAEQKKLIETLVQSGDALGAQNVILAAIEQQVGGTAEATATSSDKLRVAFDQVLETVGNALLPAFTDLVNALLPVFKAFEQAPPDLTRFLIGTVALVYGLRKLNTALIALKVSASTANVAIAALAVAAELYLALSGDAWDEISGKANEAATAIEKASDAQVLGIDLVLRQLAELQDVDLVKTYKELASSSVAAARRLLALKIAAGAPRAEIEQLAQGIRQATLEAAQGTKTINDFGNANNDAAEASKELADAQQAIIDQLQKERDAYDKALDAKLGFFNADIAARNAQRDTADALDELNSILTDISEGDYEGTMRDIAQAQDDFLSSALDSAAAQAELKRKAGDATGATKAQITELQRIQSTLAPGSPLRAALQGYIDDLTILQRVGGPLTPLLGLNRDLGQMRTGGILYEANAQGGNVYGGIPSIVGENGPELFVPQSAGYIIPNQRLGGRAAGGNVYNITVNGAVDASSTARQIRQLLQQDGQRLNLPTPVPA